MSEFRRDIFTKGWVLIAESRAKRPDDFKRVPATPLDLPESSEDCAFCPGKEKLTPKEILCYPKKGKKWLIRVVPNKYEALGHKAGKRKEGFYVSRPGIGDHEIVITRLHNHPVALQDEETIDATLKVYIDRIKKLKLHDEIHYIHIIQNHGQQAGATVIHPHSQIFGTPFVPDRVREEMRTTQDHYKLHQSCLYCDEIVYETKNKERTVLETDHFLAMMPFASKVPFQMRILPKRHSSMFDDMTEHERLDLAKVMKKIFYEIHTRMHNPAYNYYIHTLPIHSDILDDTISNYTKSYHWHLVILPRINVWAGFELGTDMYVNTVAPETAAKFFH